MEREVKRTKHRLIGNLDELENLYHLDRRALPDNMELLPGKFIVTRVAIYVDDEYWKANQARLFPRDPLTGAFCTWDPDYEEIGDLF